MDVSTGRHDLSRLRHPVHIFRIKSRNAVFRQIRCQPSRPGPGTGKKDHPVAILFPSGQILYQKLKAVIIRVDTPYRHAVLVYHPEMPAGRIQSRKAKRMIFRQSGKSCRCPGQELHLSRKQIAFLQPLHHTLLKLSLDGFSFLLYPVWFIQDKQGFLRIQIL